MRHQRATGALGGVALVLAAALVGCGPQTATDPSSSASPSPSRSATSLPSPTDDAARVLIDCVGTDGLVLGTFTRLEEAWASTNYVRIDHCTASAATDEPIVLTSIEESIAETAAVDLPDAEPVELFLLTLATCVRVSPTSTQGLTTLPLSLLRATLELCPEAPHAGLVEDELEARGL